MAQKYLQLAQQKKIKRSLQDIFKVEIKQNHLRNNFKYSVSSSKENKFDIVTPNTEIESDDHHSNKNNRNLCVNDFKYLDLRWPNVTSNAF